MTAPPLVVRTDPSKARGWLTLILVANGLLAVVCLAGGLWAAGVTEAAWGGAAFAITLAGAVFQMVFHAFAYGRMLGADTIAEIGPAGVRGPTTRWEQVALPWSSIASVAKGWNAVVVKAVDGPKLVIPVRATTSDAHTVRAAIAHFSGGRL
ncbi:MAG TPA: hypothetical protein VFU19_13330 [Iamia sp.]|nr:hypothetical protein [Iamia sp.]